MVNIEEAALAFARECLGWADAKAVYVHDPAGVPRFVVCSPNAAQDTLFDPTDLVDVKAAAQKWCDARDLTFTIEPDAVGGPSSAILSRVGKSGAKSQLSRATDPRPSHALLAACVLATRALRVE